MPSIRQSGRRMRPSCGASARRLATSGSARKWRSWEAPEAVSGTRRSSQALLRGRGDGWDRGPAGRFSAWRDGDEGVEAWRAKRAWRRRSRLQIRTINGPASLPRPNKPPPRRATAWHMPSMMRAKRSAGGEEANWDTNGSTTQPMGGGKEKFAHYGCRASTRIASVIFTVSTLTVVTRPMRSMTCSL